ncbi:hypothetical protein [Nocardia crassostreae]|uniref:hypothetical protein n=1 Tax=Nocardia crassostreae TaxID=53428 RepID=UPI000AE48327|nr:hypothetical protein [Nocardia crassostreae]
MDTKSHSMGPHTPADDPNPLPHPAELALWQRRDPIDRMRRATPRDELDATR